MRDLARWASSGSTTPSNPLPTPVSDRKPPADRATPAEPPFDAILVVSFGGPEGPDDVLPFLADTVRTMRDDGVRNALAFLTSAFSSYSGCRQYRENLFDAQQATGADAPAISRLRMLYNHPGFVAANADHVREALGRVPEGSHVAFTAHSIPVSMAKNCAYEAQLGETARLVAESVAVERWQVVYQSRSGAPHVPWLEPDVCDHLEALHAVGAPGVVLSPIGFVSDHLEVLYDLDVEAREAAERVGLPLARARAAGTHPAFVSAIREAIVERLDRDAPRRALGRFGPSHDTCAPDCCLPGTGRPSPWDA